MTYWGWEFSLGEISPSNLIKTILPTSVLFSPTSVGVVLESRSVNVGEKSKCGPHLLFQNPDLHFKTQIYTSTFN